MRHRKSIIQRVLAFSLPFFLILFPLPILPYAAVEGPIPYEDSSSYLGSISVNDYQGDTQTNGVPSGSLFEDDSPLSEASPEPPAAYMSTATPDSSTEVSEVPNEPDVTVSGYNTAGKAYLPGYVTLKTQDRSHFAYRYDVGAGAGATLDVVIAAEGQTMDLGSSFSMAVRRENDNPYSEGLDEMDVIFRDNQGREVTERITLNSANRIWIFTFETWELDMSHVESITLQHRYEDLVPDRGSQDRMGEIFIGLEGVVTPIPITGVPYDENSLTPLPPISVEAVGFTRGDATIPGFITLLNITGGQGAFRYDVAGDDKGSVVKTVFTSTDGQPIALDPQLVVAMKNNGNNADALIRVVDSSGSTGEYILDLTNTLQNFVLDLEDSFYLSNGLDRSHIEKIEIEVDLKLSPSRYGRIDFHLSQEEVPPISLEKPVVQSIPDSNTGNINVNFSSITDAVIYQVQVATDSTFSNVIHEGFPTDTQEAVSLTEDGTYYVRVRGSANQQVEVGPTSQWSDTVSFNVTLSSFMDIVPTLASVEGTAAGHITVEINPVAGAVIYQVDIATDENFTDIIHQGFPTDPVEAFTVSASGTYYVRARASQNQQIEVGPTTQWSATGSVTVTLDNFTNIVPVIDSATATNAGHIEVQIAPVTGAVIYQVDIATDSNFTDIIHQGFPTDPVESFTVSENGTYYVRARASQNQQIEVGPTTQWSATSSVEVTLDSFVDIVPVITSATATPGGILRIDVEPVADAVVYQFDVATDADFTDIVHQGFPAGPMEVVQLTESDTYYIRVRASKNQLIEVGPVTQWSTTASLDVTISPFTEIVPVITGTSADASGNVSIQFNEVSEALVYHVQIATDEDFTDIIHEGFPSSPPETTQITEDGTYYARVRASQTFSIESGPLTQWSLPASFNVAVAGALQPVTTDIETITDYPDGTAGPMGITSVGPAA
ncbi:MAG: hypothetical protein JW893_04885, partial [Candidatus Omnitrophica bacterium]|nr:hypothetical protein [Candidatus Omnitrophota bacterium]